MTPRKRRLLALQQVRQVKRALRELKVHFPQAEATLQELATEARRAILGPGLLGLDPLPLEVVHLFPQPEPFAALRRTLEEKIPEATVPPLDRIHARKLQVFQLLVLLRTRRLHLGDVLLFALDPEGDHPRPTPRRELVFQVGWRAAVRGQHAAVRQALRWLLALREKRARWVYDHRIHAHLGWIQRPGEDLLEDLLSGRRALYLHQVFELLMLVNSSVPIFVRFLYLMDAATSRASRQFLRALEPQDIITAEEASP